MNAKQHPLLPRRIAASNKAGRIQARIRQALLTAPILTSTLQSCRAAVHFGPWRHAARAIIRMARPPQAEPPKQSVSLLQFDSSRLVEALRTDGIAMAGVLPTGLLQRVRQVTDNMPPGEYGEFHEVPDVRSLVECPAAVAVARGYLRAEPALLECNLVVAHPEDPTSRPKRGSQRTFHFDYAGWDWLNLFVYLTDVSQDSGAHQIIVGTHRT